VVPPAFIARTILLGITIRNAWRSNELNLALTGEPGSLTTRLTLAPAGTHIPGWRPGRRRGFLRRTHCLAATGNSL